MIQDGRIVFANPMAMDITGYRREELLSSTLEQILSFIHPQDRAIVWQRHQDRLRGLPAPTRYDVRATRGDGRDRWLEFMSAQLSTGAGPRSRSRLRT